MADKQAVIILSANAKDFDRVLGNSEKRIMRFGKVGKLAVSQVRSSFGELKGLLGLGGIAGIVQAGRGVADFEKRLTRLSIAVGNLDDAATRSAVFGAGKHAGIDPDQLLDSVARFQELTGRGNEWVEVLREMSEVGGATGADMTDIAGTAAAMSDSLGITKDNFVEAFNVLHVQGKLGAVELRDMSKLIGKLAPQFTGFNTKGVAGLRDMGAAMQVLRKGFGSADEAATGMQAVMGSLIARQAQLKKAGVNVFEMKDGKEQLRAFADILNDIAGKDWSPKELMKILGGRKESFIGIKTLTDFNGLFNELRVAGEGTNEVMKDFDKWSKSSAAAFASADAKMKQAFNDSLRKNLHDIAGAMAKFADVLGWIGSNPKAALALAALAKFGPAIIGGLTGRGGGGVGAAIAGDVAGSAAGGAAGQGGPALAAAGLVGAGIGTGYEKITKTSRDFDAERMADVRRGIYRNLSELSVAEQLDEQAKALERRIYAQQTGNMRVERRDIGTGAKVLRGLVGGDASNYITLERVKDIAAAKREAQMLRDMAAKERMKGQQAQANDELKALEEAKPDAGYAASVAAAAESSGATKSAGKKRRNAQSADVTIRLSDDAKRLIEVSDERLRRRE